MTKMNRFFATSNFTSFFFLETPQTGATKILDFLSVYQLDMSGLKVHLYVLLHCQKKKKKTYVLLCILE